MARLYLVQHAKSKSAEEDPARGLTAEGRQEAARVSRFLAGLHLSVAVIQHSGKTRAEQTASILAEAVRSDRGLEAIKGLDPLDDPSPLAPFLTAYSEDVMLVGHLPHLERLASILLTGSPDRRPVKFRNAGVVCLEKSAEGSWSLLWVVIPEILPVT